MKTLSIINRTAAILVINLPHNLVPECATQGFVGVRTHDGETGERVLIAHKKPISGSITLTAAGCAGCKAERLPLSARVAPDVRRLAALTSIEVEEVDDAPTIEQTPRQESKKKGA